MPCNDCPLEQALVKTKSSKSHKNHKKEKCCPSVCNVECCLPDCHPDCCTPAFLRLDKLRTIFATNNTIPNSSGAVGFLANTLDSNSDDIYTRAGTTAADPTLQATFQGTDSNGVALSTTLANALLSYAFVNTERYVSFESCGKEDQVIGWYVDTATGNLELYQALPELNLALSNNRLTLDSIPTANLTTIQKQQLYQLNNLYKLSVQAIERVGANPKTEGNICEYTDKCGQKWLLLINRAATFGTSGLSAATNNTQWTLVGVKLC